MDFRLSPRGGALAAVLAIALSCAAPAAAQESEAGSTGGTPEESAEDSLRLSSAKAIEIAREDANVIEAEQLRGKLSPVAQAKPPDTWQVGFKDGDDEVVQVLVDDPTGTVRESWTGHQVEWQMARGYEGSFGGVLNAPWVWLPLCAIFLVGLLDLRRLRRIAHLDLLVLIGFGASHLFFNRGDIGVSVPLVYPALLYLLARMLWIGFRGRGEGLRPSIPGLWLGAAAIFLLAFRIVVNVADSGVIDVGYAGVIGADLLGHGNAIYGEGVFPDENRFGDTYGPANYLAYLPFELGLPWSGTWDHLPAAHAAAVAFDLATAGAMLALGMRLRPGREGRELGAVLAFAWAAFPYAAFTLAANANDSLVAALIAWSLVAFTSPIGRGILLAAVAAVKFAPLALAPLYAAGLRGLTRRGLTPEGQAPSLRFLRPALLFSGALVLASVLFLAHPAIDPGLATFYERTIASQIDRTSPFSIWGQADLDWLHLVFELFALGLAVAVAFVPRKRSFVQLCALAAAVLISVELIADHWFYLYIVWFFPALITALVLLGSDEDSEPTAPPTNPQPT
ncbi:MAG: hypothetical protein ACR2OC_06555 [Solirubrobacterales bacterium]